MRRPISPRASSSSRISVRSKRTGDEACGHARLAALPSPALDFRAMRPSLPIVGIVCDSRKIGDHAFHMVGEKYIDAARDGAGALPLLIPALTPPLEPEQILASVDGLLFTGSSSNVAPHHYSGTAPRQNTMLDEARDATAIQLMRAAEAAGEPMLCIYRGFQELNVAFAGTLHTK